MHEYRYIAPGTTNITKSWSESKRATKNGYKVI